MPDGLPPLFRQLAPFTAAWDRLGLDDTDLARLEAVLYADPEAGPVVPGGSGMRKLRFAPPGRGKRGGYRVYYQNLPSGAVVVLVIVFEKSASADLSPGLKAALARQVAAVAAEYGDPESEA